MALKGGERESGQLPPPTEYLGVRTREQGISRERTHLGHHSEGVSGRDKAQTRACRSCNESSRRDGTMRGIKAGCRGSLSAGQAAGRMPRGGDRTGLLDP